MKRNDHRVRKVILVVGLVGLGLVVSVSMTRDNSDIRLAPLHWLIINNPIMSLVLGISLSYLSYGPLSSKNNPKAGDFVVVVGFLFRLAGALLLVWAAFLWIFIFSMIGWI